MMTVHRESWFVVRRKKTQIIQTTRHDSPSTIHYPRITNHGFTLIEVVVAVSLSVILLGVLHFSMVAALESWRYSQTELSLQKTLADILDAILEGARGQPGLRSSLEITTAEEYRLETVEAAIEEHRIFNSNAAIHLNGFFKRGTGLPTAEYQAQPGLPYLPVDLMWDNIHAVTERAVLRTTREIPPGSLLRLSYHPEPKRSPDSIIRFEWNPSTHELKHIYRSTTTSISKNMFGVELTQCVFKYYNSNNELVGGEHQTYVRKEWLPLITAVEVDVTATLENHDLSLRGMAMLRNSPRQRGLMPLSEDLEFPIADSQHIKTLALGNFSGITHSDRIELEIIPESGSNYRLVIEFEDLAQNEPLIGRVQVEYPPGKVIFSQTLRTPAKQGLDLLTLGPNGLFDYDDDAEVDDPVYVIGPATLKVTRMDVRGAGCYLRP